MSESGRRLRDPWPPIRAGLGAWIRDHIRVARETVHFVSVRIGTSLLVWLLVGISLALPAGLYLVQQNLAAMTAAWEGRPGLSVYFELGASRQVVDAVAIALRADDRVSAVTVTDPDAALAEFKRFADLEDALALLDHNPLPASLEATLAPGVGVEALDDLVAKVAGRAGVAEVVVEKTWLERVSDITAVVTRLGIVLGVLFGLGAVLVTATSVRLAIEARLEELRVLKLVGATLPQMRRPFLYFGALYGLGGGLVAAMLLSLTLLIIEAPLGSFLGSYALEVSPVGFDFVFLGALLLIGAFLGVLGAMLAASARLKDLEVL